MINRTESTVMGKKNLPFDPHLIFPNNLRRHEIFYDKVKIGVRFYHKNYGAHICRWGSPWLMLLNSGLLKCAQIPGVTSKFGIFSLERFGPSWTIKNQKQFYNPRFLAIKLFEKFDFERSPQKFRFRNF